MLVDPKSERARRRRRRGGDARGRLRRRGRCVAGRRPPPPRDGAPARSSPRASFRAPRVADACARARSPSTFPASLAARRLRLRLRGVGPQPRSRRAATRARQSRRRSKRRSSPTAALREAFGLNDDDGERPSTRRARRVTCRRWTRYARRDASPWNPSRRRRRRRRRRETRSETSRAALGAGAGGGDAAARKGSREPTSLDGVVAASSRRARRGAAPKRGRSGIGGDAERRAGDAPHGIYGAARSRGGGGGVVGNLAPAAEGERTAARTRARVRGGGARMDALARDRKRRRRGGQSV